MGQYTVIEPCAFISGGKAVHHARPSAGPVEVDDSVAGPLVSEGKLAAWPPSSAPVLVPVGEPTAGTDTEADGEPTVVFDDEPAPSRPKRPRRSGLDEG